MNIDKGNQVVLLRKQGDTFQQIGEKLNMTRQGDQVMYNVYSDRISKRLEDRFTKEELINKILKSDWFRQRKFNIDLMSCCKYIDIPSHKISGKILGVTRRNRLKDMLYEFVKINQIDVFTITL